MFHMLTCFNLRPAVGIEAFGAALDQFSAHMVERDLLHMTGPIGRRQTDTIMDTDDERDHEYFFIMSFRDRAQCDRAVEFIYRHEEPVDLVHNAVYANIKDQVFICWEDIQPSFEGDS